MKIFVDARPLNSPFFSGIPFYTLKLLKEFARRDDGNKYVLFSNAFRPITPLMERFDFPRGKFSEVNLRVPNRPANFFTEWLGFPRFGRGADVAWSPHIIPLRTRGKMPHVLTVHDLAFDRFPQFFSVKERLWYALPRPWAQARRATRVIAVSSSTKQDIVERWSIPEEKITVVHMGIHEEYVYPEQFIPSGVEGSRRVSPPASARGELVEPEWVKDMNYPFVLSVGTLEPRKNFKGLIKAFELIAGKPEFLDMKLVIAGNRGWLWKDIERKAELSPFRRRILFMRGLENKDIASLYRKAFVFAYPSFFEGFGFPPLEAQACGTPVVASREGGLEEVLGNSAYFIDPHQPESIALGLEKVLTDGDLRKELVRRGKKNAKRFSWEKCAEETLAVFREVSLP